MAKQISDNNKEIVRLDTVQRKNMNDAYNTEMAKLDKIQVKHDKYVNLEQQIENIEAEKVRVNNIVSIDVINQAATDNNVKVLKNSTLDKQKEKIIKKLDNDIAKLQTEQLKNPFVGTLKDDYAELERQYLSLIHI